MAVTAAHHDRRVADPHGLPVLARNAIFGLKGFAASAGFLRGMNDGVIFDRDVTYPISRTRKPFLSGVAEHRFDLWADVEPLAIDAEFRDVTYGRDLFDEHAVFSFGIGARTLRAQLLGDVVAHANRAAVGQGSNGHFGGDHCSVAVEAAARQRWRCTANAGIATMPVGSSAGAGAGALAIMAVVETKAASDPLSTAAVTGAKGGLDCGAGPTAPFLMSSTRARVAAPGETASSLRSRFVSCRARSSAASRTRCRAKIFSATRWRSSRVGSSAPRRSA